MKVIEGGFGKKDAAEYHMGQHLVEVVSNPDIKDQSEGMFFVYITDGETSALYSSVDSPAETLLCIETAKFLFFNQMYSQEPEDE